MTPWLLALVTAAALVPREVEVGGLRIDVEIQSHVYLWTVTNLSAPPVMSFEIAQLNCYSQQGPRGWTIELDGDRMRAWTDDPARAIGRNQSATFQAQVTSSGAVLGAVPLALGFGPGDEPLRTEVWGPVRMPRSIFVVITATIVGIGLFHALVVERRRG